MEITRPIIVSGLGRSGTSIIAGLLHAHGCWTGLCRPADEHNPKGYFENRRVNQLLNRAEDMRPGEFYDQILRILRKERYRGGPWVVKHRTIPYWKVWDRFRPIWVLTIRDIWDVKCSQERALKEPEDIQEVLHIMRKIADNKRTDAMYVYPGQVVHGFTTQLVNVLSRVGLEYSPETTMGFIDRSLWHG